MYQQDTAWNLYENPRAFPRAWLVHDILTHAPDAPTIRAAQPWSWAISGRARSAPSQDAVSVSKIEANYMALEVRAGARRLPVLSETFYRGWHAVVNGTGQRIYRVNGGLRGIISSDGEQPRCSGRPAGIILRRSAPQPAGFRRNGAVHRRPWPLNFLESAQCFPGDSLESRAACGWRLPPLRFSFQVPWNSL